MKSKFKNRLAQLGERSGMAVFMALVISLSNVGVETSRAAVPPEQVGNGFVVTEADLAYILQQIKIAEHHAQHINDDPAHPCASLLGNGPNQIPSPLLSFGLRTVDGSCNNLQPGQEVYGAADQAFPRLTTPTFEKPAEDASAFGGPVISNYNQTSGAVADSQPRMISNLIVDQTSTNPAAVFVAGFPARTQGNEGVVPCDENGLPLGCVPAFQTLFIPNVTTDVGLSPPFNSLFTIFGQFFDHGLDKITNGGSGAVFVPLKPDDPLVAGNNHILEDPDGTGCSSGNIPTCDDLPAGQRFMVLTRGQIKNLPGPDGILGENCNSPGATPACADDIRSAPNTDSPFVDQSQTYTSHASHQAFLREYTLVDHDNNGNTPMRPLSTGKFLSETGATAGTLATWASIKQQAAQKLGLALQDQDIHDIPMLATDPYGNFIPGPQRGLPQFVTATGLVEGDIALPIPTPANATRIHTAFLNDLAPNADPGTPTSPKLPDGANGAQDHFAPPSPTTYDDELLDQHFICGDGRCNENIALTAVHQVFHSEHDRLAAEFETVTLPANPALQAGYQATNCPVGCATNSPGQPITFTYGQRLFQAARFVTEMQYQHLVFEEFARKVQPLINPFEPFAFNQTDVDPAITAEFAHAVYRFGHSMLNDSIPRVDVSIADINDKHYDIELFDAFLNPVEFNKGKNGELLDSSHATGGIIMGLSDQVGNEIDEFVADTLRNRLLGLPLDLPTLNMTRARSEGIPSLNNVRKQLHAATNDGGLKPYESWTDFSLNMKNVASLPNFIAAYGTHPHITTLDPDGGGPVVAGSIEARRIAVDQILNNTTLKGPDGILGTGCGTNNATPACDDDIFAPRDSAKFLDSANFAGAPAIFSPGLDGVIGVDCGTPTASPECTDNTVLVPAAPPKDWRNIGNVSQTGLDDIDLWVGGLAEATQLFGGLLGSTFNYVFEKQLTDLQNGDRFYYLARTPGMNLRAQLEGNSFSELVMRNSNAHTLKADPFATADCKFELANLAGTAAEYELNGSIVQDDPNSECDERALLIRSPDGQIRYRTSNTVDTPGINGQGVYNGTVGVDRIFGGVDNDTFWGLEGDDIIDGGFGDDFVLGGEGDDIITDAGGADFLKGGPGNDAIDGGPGDDIITSASGQDFTNGGQNLNETFSGPDDDFAIAGKGADAVFGDSGDDWEEGDDQPDLLIGDSSTLFFDDHNRPGHDVMIGQGGDDDYDMEGGDDIGVNGPGVEKVAGASGFDWETSVGNPQAMFADLALPIVNAPPANETRDRFNEVEALSGWNLNDTLRGDSIVPSQLGGGGFIGCDALDAIGVGRIAGLNALVTSFPVPAATVIASSVTNYCLLDPNGNVWGEGNILLGGAGSDTIEGRGADDIIDGDRYLNVRLSVRNGSDNATGADTVTNGSGAEVGSTNLMTGLPITGSFGPGSAGMNLQQAVFAGKVNPGNIKTVREILTPIIAPAAINGDCTLGAAAVNCDKALFSGPANEYTITVNPNGSVTVADNADPGAAAPIVPAAPRNTDGIDTLWNMEQLIFCNAFDLATDTCTSPAAPISVVPLASVTPNARAFANQIVGTTSASQPITVTNTGLKSLSLTGVAITGADASQYTLAAGTTCTATTTLTSGSSCTINVSFAPTSAGAKNAANVSITHNASGSPALVALTGTGEALVIPPAPASVADGFNRANANNLGANWQQVVLPLLGATLRVNANQATANLLGATGSAFFTTVGGATQGGGFTYANATVNNTALFLKTSGGIAGAPMNGIRVLYNVGNVTIATTTNAGVTYTTAGTVSTGGALVNGNKLLAAVDGNGRVWVWKVVGTTTSLLTTTGVLLPNNALWTTGGGRVGMQLPNGSRVDDFIRQ